MSINLSNTLPAAPTGSVNVSWQQDSSGNVSAYSGLGPTKTTVAPVAGVVTINCALGSSFWVTVNAAITSMVLTNMTDGQEITVVWNQDGIGHAVAVSSELLGTFSVTLTANKSSCYKWTYNSANGFWYHINDNNM